MFKACSIGNILCFRHRVLQKNQPFMDLNAGEKGTLMVGLANGLGGMQWELVGTLFLSWVVVYLIIWKGLHSSGKVGIETVVQLWLSKTQSMYRYL